jgi:hypothetical protein
MDVTRQLDAERTVQELVPLGLSIVEPSNITMNQTPASPRSAVAGYRER